MAAPDAQVAAVEGSDQLVASRANMVMGFFSRLKENASNSVREVRGLPGHAPRAPSSRQRATAAALGRPGRLSCPPAPTRRPPRRRPRAPTSASFVFLQAKPWAEVLDRTALAKPAGTAEVSPTALPPVLPAPPPLEPAHLDSHA